uniref:Uncharacterized protein n=1 Tax=Tetradesmus obliquus TaxID=3088 RepID=A0A383WQD6_TETOB|eukprot:jgi/Sobl393_1/20093/SZX79166.1
MQRKLIICLFASLLLAQAYADGPKERQVDPAVGAAAGAIGAATGLPLSALTAGLVPASAAASAVANKVIAGDSAAKALANGAGAAGALVGGLFAGHAAKLGALGSAHTLAGKALVDIVRAINSLHIAGTNIAVGVADNALGAVVGKIRAEALAIGSVYTQLIGEFGRHVGNGLTAIETLGSGGLRFLNPLSLGIDALELHLNSLILFLQELAAPSVAGPGRGLALAPFIGTLQATRGLLGALQGALMGPTGGVLNAFDNAISAAGSVIGGPAGAAGGIAGAAAGAAGAVANAVGGAALGSTANLATLVGEAIKLVDKLI